MPLKHSHGASTESGDNTQLSCNNPRNTITYRKGKSPRSPPVPSFAFTVLRLSKSRVDELISTLTLPGLQSIYSGELKATGRRKLATAMKTRDAWSKNLANSKNTASQDDIANIRATGMDLSKTKPKTISTKTNATPNRKSILKHGQTTPVAPSPALTRRQPTVNGQRAKKVLFTADAFAHQHYLNEVDATDASSLTIDADSEHGGTEESDANEVDVRRSRRGYNMSQPGHRPSLKLKLSTNNFNTQPPPVPSAGAQTPNPQSAIRTPSIKLNFGRKPSISTAATPAIKKETQDGAAPSSGKKRKRTKVDDGSEDELAKPVQPQRRLTLKTPAAPAKTPVTPGPIFKLKTKGKVPKRALGVGYDSELEEREVDPVLLEGFILRMPPGPDCDYVQAAVRDGTVGVHRSQGGPDIRIRCLDTNGRRGIIYVNGHQYATSVVDLPCIIEGMKSWDKKGWIKSIDICQMMLVLGPCTSDDEAKNYPLPSEVDPKTFAYAHGVTAPMKWVRKRRFARTRRARVDDIESIERKVNALLEADNKALASSFHVYDHDPRIEQDQYSEVEDEYEDDDAEGELDDSYFPRQAGVMVETPGGMAMDVHVDQDQIADIEAMFNEDDDDNTAPVANGHAAPKAVNLTLHAPAPRDSSVAVTSASGSPSASAAVTAAPTPAEAQQASSDEDDDDDDDASDRSDSEKDADDNLQQVKDRIVDMENKIREQTELLKKTSNGILKKKLAKKIGELKDDVRMMKVQNGLAAEGDDDDGDE